MTARQDETQQILACADEPSRQQVLAASFMRHRDRLKRMLDLRLDSRLQQRIDASDILQEAFLEASQRLPEFLGDPSVPLFIWLRFLVGQKLMALYRHHFGAQKRDARREISLYRGAMPQATSEALAARLLGKDTSPSDAAMRAERKIRVQEALNRMDALDRELIALRHFEQLSGAEAAQALGIKEPAARQRYVRALRKLKEILSQMPGGMD